MHRFAKGGRGGGGGTKFFFGKCWKVEKHQNKKGGQGQYSSCDQFCISWLASAIYLAAYIQFDTSAHLIATRNRTGRMGRTLNISVNSARGLYNADADEGGHSDPYVIVCFDQNVEQELCRTQTVSETCDPEWNESFEVEVTEHVQRVVEETGSEPEAITFCVFDGDAGESEALGVASVRFADLVKKGRVGGDELEVVSGTGSIDAVVEMRKVKISSMLKDNAAVKIAGGVVGVAAAGALGVYLYNRYQKKKEKLEERGEEGEKTGIVYGANIDDEEDDEEEKGNLKRWWEMDDEDEEDDEENRWTSIDEA